MEPALKKSSETDSPNPKDNFTICESNFWPVVLLLLILLAPFAAILIVPDGRVLGHPHGDSPKAYYQYGYFLGQCWRDGIMPLWNPHIMLGIPFIGEGQAAVFHPISLLFAFLKASSAVNWLVALSFVLTGLFFYGYVRALGLGRAASWCAAATWSFSSAMISRISAGHLNILLTFISMPLIMMLWEQYRVRGGVRRLIGIALGYALMIFAYYPQVLYTFSLFFLFYVLIQSGLAVADRSSTARSEGKAILFLGLSILLGIGVGAIQLLPAIDFVAQSFRQEATVEFCGSLSFPPENLLTLIAPRFFGSTFEMEPGRYWGRSIFWEMWIYAGVLPLIMAVVGAWAAPRRLRAALLVCGGIFLVLGLGRNTFLFPLVYKYVPFFDMFRGPSKNTLITLFCLVTLSAFGFEALFGEMEKSQRQRFRRVAFGTAALLFLVCAGVAFFLVRGAEAGGSNWEKLIKMTLNSGEVCFTPLTSDGQKLAQITSNEAAAALTRTFIFLALSAVLIFLTLPYRWRNWTFLLPIALILADLMGIFLPMLPAFEKSMAQLPLDLEPSARTPYPPRLLVPYNPMPNIAMRSGYSSVFGLTGNTLKRYNDLINHLQKLNPKESRAESRLIEFTPQFGMLGFDAAAVPREDARPGAKQIGQLGTRVIVPFRNEQEPSTRAFLAAAPKYVSRPDDALSHVLSNSMVWISPAIERTEKTFPASPLEKYESVHFISFERNRIELEARTSQPRELVLCEMFEGNWKAKINDRPAPVVPANYVFRAVQVPAGTSRVVFEYKPTPFYAGAVVTSLSTAVVLSLLLNVTFKSRRRNLCSEVSEMQTCATNCEY